MNDTPEHPPVQRGGGNTPEPLDAILAEMREQADEPAIESLGEVISPIDPDDVKDWAYRLEEAVNRMRDAYCDLCKEKDAAYDRLLLERDKAIKMSASGNVATMREALERILDIEGYGAPLIEAKCIAQKALEGQQCTPPLAQEKPKIEQPGNAAAMREALEQGRKDLWELMGSSSESFRETRAGILSRRIRAALAAPPRNCDVGTADEQAERFEAECHRHEHCTPCPVHKEWGEFKYGKPKSCQMIWSQMPFAPAEGENKQ